MNEKYISMKHIINHINSILNKFHFQFDSEVLNQEYFNIKVSFEENLAKVKEKGPIKFVIIAEAPLSSSQYFYNSQSCSTSFLNPAYFNCENHKALREYFVENGIVVFDLYPIPLPTFIYDNVKFNCKEIDYSDSLVDYYNAFKKEINDETKFILRYSKLKSYKKKRCEWDLFLKTMNLQNQCITSISSKNVGASEDKIKEIFKIK